MTIRSSGKHTSKVVVTKMHTDRDPYGVIVKIKEGEQCAGSEQCRAVLYKVYFRIEYVQQYEQYTDYN